MRKLALAIVLALTGLSGAAHASGPRFLGKPVPVASARPSDVPMTTAQIRRWVTDTKMTKVNVSKGGVFAKFNAAYAANPGEFHAVKLGERTALVPKVQIKGLDSNTAYIQIRGEISPVLIGKVKLPSIK